MAIHAISGKPGGGKSMYAMKLLIHELVFGSRVVVTNLAINEGGLNEYLQENFPHLWRSGRSFNLSERLRIIDEDEMGKFWTIRGHYDAGITVLTKEDWGRGKLPNYSGVKDSGCAYFLDEVHIKFNARAWMETARDALHYLSQHRKMGDTVVWITQAVENVDKQFRSVTQDYTYLANLSKQKYGMFTMPAVFIRRTFLSPNSSPGSEPVESGMFKLDVRGVGKCYDTAKGIGIHNAGGADKGERRKGVPWYVFAVGFPALLILLGMSVPNLAAKWFMPNGPEKAKPVSARGTNVPAPAVNGPTADIVVTNTVSASRSNSVVWCVACSQTSKGWLAVLSDGRTLSSQRGTLSYVDTEEVRSGTNVYRMKPEIYEHRRVIESVKEIDTRATANSGGVVGDYYRVPTTTDVTSPASQVIVFGKRGPSIQGGQTTSSESRSRMNSYY